MDAIIQCVPNFSEGRDLAVVESIVEAVREASDAKIVDYSSDPDHNRMVLTLLGKPDEIRDAVFVSARQAVESIDIRGHEGIHPRIGAVDVVPLVPLRGMTMQECVGLSYQVGNDLAKHLDLPIYFYEESAILAHRANLAVVRKGGYEELSASELEEDRLPDLGPHKLHRTAGATVVGARGPLVAYNIILASDDLALAKAIAAKLRDGSSGLEGIKSLGLLLASRSQAQVSMNLTKPDLTPLKEVFRFVEGEAKKAGVEIAESEIIGALSRSSLEGTSPEELKALKFKESQVLENWI